MKVLVINQSDTKGGAAIVPWRLWDYIGKHDSSINVHFLVSRKYSTSDKVSVILPRLLFYTERIINKVTDFLGLQYFFLPFSTVSIVWHVAKFKPDLIHLNNIHGGYFWLPLLRFLGKKYPILWTAHDVWPVHRNSAFFVGYENWKLKKVFPGEKNYYPKIALDTGELLLHYKSFVYKNSLFTVVTPSRWLKKDILEVSPLMKDKEIYHIYNGIDVATYRNHLSKSELREAYHIPVNEKVLIFVAAFLDVPLKGMKELIETLRIMDAKTSEKVHLICVGDSTPEMFPKINNIMLHQTGYISDPMEIRDYFALSDLFLYTSKAESLGMVVIESIASGTPAIVFDVGGCPEIIEDGKNGYVIPAFDVDLFANKAMTLLNDPIKLAEFSKNGQEIAAQKFSIEKMAKEYLALCSKMLKQHGKNTD